MGATKKSALRVTFEGRVKMEFHGSKVTSDAGLLAYRELDEALDADDVAGETGQDRRAQRTDECILWADWTQAERVDQRPLVRYVNEQFAVVKPISGYELIKRRVDRASP